MISLLEMPAVIYCFLEITVLVFVLIHQAALVGSSVTVSCRSSSSISASNAVVGEVFEAMTRMSPAYPMGWYPCLVG